ncbi:MAG: hypothetical protein P4L79_10975 [Legionella sp.]|uniref:hypothetical protein n=1 Tax=Legionella sp. TaxID=459 RepID=UPI00284857BA|nr:hypothetical protein [Legionella sp.]
MSKITHYNQNTKRQHYVDNKKLFENIKIYLDVCKKHVEERRNGLVPTIPNSIAVDIQKICVHLSYSYQFINYSYKEEMIGDGILSCIQAVPNYMIEKPNAFAYFTMIAFNAFVNRINKEQKQHYIKHKNIYNSMNGELLTEVQATMTTKDGVSLVDASDRVIEQYEEKIRKQKQKLLDAKEA